MAANKKTLLLFILLHCFLVISQEANAQKYSANGRSGFTAEEQEFLKDLEEAKSRPGSYYDFLSEKWGLAASPVIQQKWRKYLKDVESSDTKTQQAVLIGAYQNYLRADSTYEQKLKQCGSSRIDNNAWITDLRKEFGRNYIKSHRMEIRSIIFYLEIKNQKTCTESERKDLLEAEAVYYSVLKSHLKNVIQFLQSDRLTTKEKQKIESRIRITQLYLNLLNKVSVANLIFITAPMELALQERVMTMPRKLVDFLSVYPAFSKPFKIDLSEI